MIKFRGFTKKISVASANKKRAMKTQMERGGKDPHIFSLNTRGKRMASLKLQPPLITDIAVQNAHRTQDWMQKTAILEVTAM
jgi:hypothetical protein